MGVESEQAKTAFDLSWENRTLRTRVEAAEAEARALRARVTELESAVSARDNPRYVARQHYDDVVIWDTLDDKEVAVVANCFHGGRQAADEAMKKAKTMLDKINK